MPRIEWDPVDLPEEGEFTVTGRVVPDPPPTPDPTPDPVPAKVPNTVRVDATTWHVLDAVNPTPQSHPSGYSPTDPTWSGRGPNELVAWSEISADPTNRHGVTAVLSPLGGDRWEVTVLMDRERTGAPGPMLGAGQVVLAGHGEAAQWMRDRLAKGMSVWFASEEIPDPRPVVTPTIAVYVMDGPGRVSQVPPECNEIRVAFLQGSGLVEWGGDTPGQTAADLTAWTRARVGNRVLVSAGGQGGIVDLSAIPAAMSRIGATFPTGGFDWDIEKGGFDVATVVDVSLRLADGRGDGWVTSFVPPGGPPVAPYLDAAERCQRAGLKVVFGQQTYMTTITRANLLGAFRTAADRLGPENVLIGCMVGDDPGTTRTVAQWAEHVHDVRGEFGTLGGVYLWASHRAGTPEWARAVTEALT